jgi:hypothetical protein
MVSDSSMDPQLQTRNNEALVEAVSASPDDLGLQILAAQNSLSEGVAADRPARLGQLIELTNRLPLDAAPKKGGFSTAQRQAAMRQVGLWLVARECLKQEPLRTTGTQLAERSLEAARRQTDNSYSQAILREWGQLAIDSGDKATAERCWTEMLEAAIPKK